MTTPGLGDSISGVTLVDETIRQRTADGTPLASMFRVSSESDRLTLPTLVAVGPVARRCPPNGFSGASGA